MWVQTLLKEGPRILGGERVANMDRSSLCLHANGEEAQSGKEEKKSSHTAPTEAHSIETGWHKNDHWDLEPGSSITKVPPPNVSQLLQ